MPFFRDAESVILWAVNEDPQIILSVSQLTAATVGAGWILEIGQKNLAPNRLGYLLAERQLQISGLHEQIAAAETEILNRQAELTGIYRSRKWRLVEKLARIARDNFAIEMICQFYAQSRFSDCRWTNYSD